MSSKRSIIGVLEQVDGAAIKVRQGRCAKVRNRNVVCLKCAEACTSGCISLIDGELTIDASACVGCGTCATVCPTCALEARNPSDAQLLNVCLAATDGPEAVIMCEQVRRAVAGYLDEGKAACVVCLGRVEESLTSALAANGAKHIRLICGDCDCCEQAFGLSTAQLVAETSNVLFRAWESASRVTVEKSVPVGALLAGASAREVQDAVAAYFADRRGNDPVNTAFCTDSDDMIGGSDVAILQGEGSRALQGSGLVHVMKDGTLPHFMPDRREKLLANLAALGQPRVNSVTTRLWGQVIIDGQRCTSCRMCTTFCPTGALRRFDEEGGAFGVDHYPGDCVKCGSCQDVCPEQALRVLEDVKPTYLMDGAVHHYTMAPRAVQLGNAHQILNTMRQHIEGDVFER